MHTIMHICLFSIGLLGANERFQSQEAEPSKAATTQTDGIQIVEIFRRPLVEMSDPPLRGYESFPFIAAVFSPNGSKLVVHRGGSASVWDAKSGKKIHRFSFSDSRPVIGFSSDGRYLYTCNFYAYFNRQITKWDLLSGKQVFVVPGTGQTIRSFPGDKEFYGISSGEVIVRDAETGKVLRRLKSESAIRPRFRDTNIGEELLPAGKIRLWNLRTFKEIGVYDLPTERSLLSPNQKVFLKRDVKARTITFWTFPNGEKIRSIESVDIPDRMAFGFEDRIIAVAYKRTIEKPKLVKNIANPFPPNPKAPKEESHWTVCLYDIASGKKLATLDRPQGRPDILAFSPDGTLLAASSENIIQVWRITWPKEKGKK